MLTKESIIAILQEQKAYFQNELRVKRIGVFGRYARGSQKPENDIDVLSEMPPVYTNLCTVWKILEDRLSGS